MNIRHLIAMWIAMATAAAHAGGADAASVADRFSSLRVYLSTPAESFVVGPTLRANPLGVPYVPVYTQGPAVAPAAAATVLAAGVLIAVAAQAAMRIELKKRADERRFEFGPLLDALPAFDAAETFRSGIEEEIKASAGDRSVRAELGGRVHPSRFARIAEAARSGAVLFIDLRHAVSVVTSGSPYLLVSAEFNLVDRDGEVLSTGVVEFAPPHSPDESMDVQLAWWAQDGRYAALLHHAGHAIGKAIALRVFGKAEHLAVVGELRETPGSANTFDVSAFARCDDFHKSPAAGTSYGLVEFAPPKPPRVGLLCAAGR